MPVGYWLLMSGDYKIYLMQPTRVGRKIGVGARVASVMLRDRAVHTAQAVRQDAPVYAARAKSTAAGVKRGGKRFGESIWGPFVHAGGVLWLEISGCFFAIFGLFFVQGVYRLRDGWQSGPNHEKVIVYGCVALAFFYFSVTSFYRAHKKQQKKRQQG
ncbi:MAG: hypothetical protein ACRD3F_13720 [Acidobacteriaceae bacterium]